jgi:hypothetical protein
VASPSRRVGSWWSPRRDIGIEDLRDVAVVEQVVPEEETVPPARLGDLGEFDEPMGLSDAIEGGKE